MCSHPWRDLDWQSAPVQSRASTLPTWGACLKARAAPLRFKKSHLCQRQPCPLLLCHREWGQGSPLLPLQPTGASVSRCFWRAGSTNSPERDRDTQTREQPGCTAEPAGTSTWWKSTPPMWGLGLCPRSSPAMISLGGRGGRSPPAGREVDVAGIGITCDVTDQACAAPSTHTGHPPEHAHPLRVRGLLPCLDLSAAPSPLTRTRGQDRHKCLKQLGTSLTGRLGVP